MTTMLNLVTSIRTDWSWLAKILSTALFAGDQEESIILGEREEKVSIYDEYSPVKDTQWLYDF